MSPTPAIPAAGAWDAETLDRLAALMLRARQAVDGLASGGHRAVRVSPNVEFADYKEYTPGDNLRDLDWRVFARADRLVVRRHEAETELACTIVIDASADMGTGTTGRLGRPPLDGNKFGYALTLAATLAYWLSTRREPVGLQVVGGEDVAWRWLPARSGTTHLAQLFGTLAQLRPGGRADLGTALQELGARGTRRSVVFLVSDLMEEPETWGPSLSALASRRLDLRVLHIHDRAEWALDYKAASRFVSPEGGQALPIDPASARSAMAEVVDEYLTEVRGYLGQWRGHHVLVPTDAALDQVLKQAVRGL